MPVIALMMLLMVEVPPSRAELPESSMAEPEDDPAEPEDEPASAEPEPKLGECAVAESAEEGAAEAIATGPNSRAAAEMVAAARILRVAMYRVSFHRRITAPSRLTTQIYGDEIDKATFVTVRMVTINN